MQFFKRSSGVSWIVVFLGNPGSKYNKTRHNAGFMAGDILAERLGVRLNRLKFTALTGICKIGNEKVLLMKPQTFMNLSGNSAREAMAFHKVPPERLLVISDDTALPIGKLRIRKNGSAGGHNGLKSIIEKCGGEGFPRIKIGVGEPDNKDMDLADWVLAKMSEREQNAVRENALRAADAIVCVISDGFDKAMGKFN